MKLVIFLLLAFSTVSLYTQNETGIRSGNLENMNYFDIHNNIYPFQVPIIKNIPPIDSFVPNDIYFGYRVVDSLAKLFTTEQAIAYINTLHWNSDTMKTILRYLYNLENYDFVRFNQYLYETEYNQLGRYKSNLNYLRRFLISKYLEDNIPNKMRNISIIGSNAILLVEVVKIDSMKALHPSVSRNVDTLTYDFYKATFRILDTLKGIHLPCSVPDNNLKEEQIHSFSYPTMFVKFDDNTYWQDKNESHRSPFFKKIEPMFYDTTKKMFCIKSGDTAIVFLDNSYLQSKTTYDYFYLRLSCYYSNGALPIVNGMVKDINHIWFDQDFTPYQDWKNHFNSVKDSIFLGGN